MTEPKCSDCKTIKIEVQVCLDCGRMLSPGPNGIVYTTILKTETDNAALQRQVEEFEASFELYNSASMRGIKMWQEATGEDLVWPDQGHLIVWLMKKMDKLRIEMEPFIAQIDQRKIAGLYEYAEYNDETLEAVEQRDCDNCSITGLLCPIRNNDPPFTFPCPHWQALETEVAEIPELPPSDAGELLEMDKKT